MKIIIPRTFSEKTIFTRIVNQHFMLVLFIVGALLAVVFVVSGYMVRQAAVKSYDESLEIASTQVRKDFDVLVEAMDALASDHEMRRYMVFCNQFGKQGNLRLPQVLSRKLAALENDLKHGELSVYTQYEPVILNAFKPNPMYDLLLDTKFISSISEDTVYYRFARNRENTIEAFAIVLPVMDFMSVHPLGYIQVAYDPETLQNLIRAKAPFKHPMILRSGSGEIVFSESDSNIAKNYGSLKENGSTQGLIQEGEYLVSTKPLDPYGINISLLVSNSELTKPLVTSFMIILPLIMLLIFFDLFMSKRLVRRITEPIGEIVAAMEAAEHGNFKTSLEKWSGIREINLLNRSFSRMLTKIQQLIDTNYKAEILKQKAELEALQQKINPHFLYNSLEIISSQAILDGSPNVSRMAQRLGRLFRYNLNAPEWVSVNEEMKYLKDYIELWKLNNRCRISYSATIAVESRECQVPKLIFQPILENALKHGAIDGRPDLAVGIDSRRAGDSIMVTIDDNGCGMAPEVLESLNSRIGNDEMSEMMNFHYGHGILGSRDRLAAIYGSQFSLKYLLSDSGGTRVEILMPAREFWRDDHV